MIIGFVTCEENILNNFFPTPAEPDFISPEPGFTPDDYLAVQDLRAAGHEVRSVIWGTPAQLLRGLDLIIIRSPWDYTDSERNKEKFFAWLTELERAHLPLQNPPALMRWLLNKHYLQDFALRGINVIPTQYLPAGTTVDLPNIYKVNGPTVFKQCIGAGGNGLYLINSIKSAKKQQDNLNFDMQFADYMLQPLVPEIKKAGEWSLTYFGGKYSHSILKKPAKGSIMVHAERGGTLHFPVTPPDSVIAFANQVFQQLPSAFKSVLYLRIDVIETKEGPVLVECEGVEPELFFRAEKGSEKNFRLAIETMETRLLEVKGQQ